MDFFATGGFQQLFSDLHEPAADYAAKEISEFDTYLQQMAAPGVGDSCHTYELYADTSECYYDGAELCEPQDSYGNYDDYYELLNVGEASRHVDDNNNTLNSTPSALCEKSLVYAFSATDLDLDMEAAAYITREMADWEDKFLDNYIEIPELVDILPEKTPLCTETCEHFLQESSKQLKLHRKVKTTLDASKAYPCTYGNCQKIYAKPAHLKAHLRRHLGEKPYICNWPACTWKFSRSDELARHRRSHSGVKPYKCDYCTKCFARSDHLTKHRKVHERRMLAASKAGKVVDGVVPFSVLSVRPGRKRKNQIC